MALNGKRIFLVEDNAGNKAVIKTILETNGAKVLSPFVTQHILEILSEYNPIDLIILDLMLPGAISGFELFATLRTNPLYAEIPIIAMSAADSSYMKKARDLGFSGYISKPVRFNQFPVQIDQVIAGNPIWQ